MGVTDDMAQTFKDRLKILMNGDRPYSWSKKTGIEKGLFQYYWQKGKIPTYENLLKIQRHSGCSLDWLLTGRLPLLDDAKIENLSFAASGKESGTRQQRFTAAARRLKALYESADEAKLGAIETVLAEFTPSMNGN